GEVRFYAAPRRLAVVVDNLDETTPSKEVVVWGPPVKVAFDSEGLLTKAGEAFARKNAIDPATISAMVENDGSQDKLCLRTTSEGVATHSLLGDLITTALAA